MNANKLLLLVTLVCSISSAQNIQLETGLNLTKYHFINSTGKVLTMEEDGIGSYHRLEGVKPINFGLFVYGVTLLNLNNNTQIESSSTSVIYKTNYLEVYIGWGYSFPYGMDFSLRLGLNSMIKGTQLMNSELYYLQNNEEFNGIWMSPSISFSKSIFNSEYFNAAISYGLLNNYRSKNDSDQKLKFFSQLVGLKLLLKSPKTTK